MFRGGASCPLILRRAVRGDLAAVMAVEEASFPRPYSLHIFQEFLTYEPEGFVVAEDGGRVVGYILFNALCGRGLITSLAVASDIRGRGVGRRLVSYALQRLSRRVETVELQVAADDAEAIRFYEGMGFRRVRRLHRYYEDGGDAYLMRVGSRA